MDWDQIENKWAVMTRRVRADWATGSADSTTLIAEQIITDDPTARGSADRSTYSASDTPAKLSIE
ncbi:MAG: hypothetical protein ACK4NH_05950 [Gemmobacter sp.]